MRKALINMKSGNSSDCLLLYRELSEILGEENVFDLSNVSPMDVIAAKDPKEPWNLFVCGGDGTVAWVLSVLDEFRFGGANVRPVINVVPLGTGNDLSRALGWGPGFTSSVNVRDLIESYETESSVSTLDRWRVVVTSLSSNDEAMKPQSSVFYSMNNYISFGCDAEVCNKFAALRESLPALCSSRLGNKVIYTLGGTGAFFTEHLALDKHCKLEVDGKKVAIPKDIYGLMILNIHSYAGGADLFGDEMDDEDGGFLPQAFNDGRLEVVGVSGTFQLGSSTLGLTQGHRIAQGSELALHFLSPGSEHEHPVWYQLDGEPSAEALSAPAVVRIHLMSKEALVSVRDDES